MVNLDSGSQQSKQIDAIKNDSLQQEVIDLLDQINRLIDDTQANLSNSDELKYDRVQTQISAAGQNVANLELRMAIVAPMKAGKSTIINAIAGQELLPSCAAAMTTIPTEIVFKTQQKQALLHISADSLSLFQQLELSRNHLLVMRDDLTLRHNAISQDTAKIHSEIESLTNDLDYLTSCRDRLSCIADVKIKLQQNLQVLLEQLKTEAAIDWFGTIPFYKQEQYKKLYKKEDYYAVSVHEIVKQINLSSDVFVDEMQQILKE